MKKSPIAGRIGLVLLVACALAMIDSGAAERPNVLLIFTDDQGIHDVGCYGSEIPTPNIDRIATEGLKFDSWYSASSICTPSRFGLLTGMNPSRSRDSLLSALMFMGEEDASRGLQRGERTIASVLKEEAGYATALIGKWHLGHGSPDFLPVEHGFDRFIGHTGGCIDFFTMTYGIRPDWYHQREYVSENGYATELITEEAVDYLASRREASEPFFLYLAYNAPHFGKGWSPKDQEPVNIMQPQAADLKRVEYIDDKIRREFAAMVVSLDDGVGRVLSALDEYELSRDTLVIFLTDHGGDPVYGGGNEPYRGRKATLFEGGIRVPCLMRWPGRIKAGRTSEAVCSSVDLFRTFGSLAGLEAEGLESDGIDLSAHIEGGDGPEGRELFWETGAHSRLGRSSWSALRRGNWKYVNSPTEGEFLFDVAADPRESKNLANSRPELFKELRERRDALAKMYREG